MYRRVRGADHGRVGVLESLMAAVAQRFRARMLAAAEMHLFGFVQLDLDGLEAGALVRAIAERLSLGAATGAPPVGAGLERQGIGRFLGNDGIGHGGVSGGWLR